MTSVTMRPGSGARTHTIAGCLSALAGLLLLLSGCGGATAPASSSTGPSGSAASAGASASARTPASAAGQPQNGGTLKIAFFTGDPPAFDPYLNTSFRVQQFAGVFYSRLLMYKTGPDIKPSSFIPTGDLADTWDVAKDGLTYTFHLRENAKWQNLPPLNGRPVTADDVVYSFDRFTKSGVQKSLMSNVAAVKAVDPAHVAFTLKSPDATFENLLASPVFYIVPKEVVQQDGDLNKTVVGSGPWMFSSYQKGVQVVAKRNPNYYITGSPHLDELDLLIIPSADTQVASFRSHQLDVVPVVPQTQVDALAKTNSEAVMTNSISNLLSIFYWKVNAAPFNDVRVRQAVSLALDREEQINDLFNGHGAVNTAIPAGLPSWWLSPTGADFGPNAAYFKHDLNKAKSLLAAAGYQNGLTVPMISTLNAYGDTFNQGVELVQKELKEAGINVKFQSQDYAAYISSTYLGKFADGAMIYGLETPVQEPNDYLFAMYDPKGPRNQVGVDDPKLTQMIQQQKITLDKNQRKQMIDDIQRYLAEQQYYVIGPAGQQTGVVQPWVKNVYWETDYAYIPEVFNNAWIQGKPS